MARFAFMVAVAGALALACSDDASEEDASSPSPPAAEPQPAAAAPQSPATPVAANRAPAEDDGQNHIVESRDGTTLWANLISSRGHRFRAQGELPPPADGPGRAAALLVPSQVYGIQYPQTLEIARQLHAQGLFVLRFDWASADGERPGPPSTEPDALVHERSEIESALSVLTKHPRVDPRRVLIVGRGAGAVAAYAVFGQHDARALVLLEPPCLDARGFKLRYPDLKSLRKPVLFASLRAAPQCPAAVLTRALRGAPPNVEHTLVETKDELAGVTAAFWSRVAAQAP